MIQGATLDAAFVDPQDAGSKVCQTMQTAAYVCLSRVKELLKISVVQPFSPLLFTRGPPGGPHRLMRKLSQQITTQQASDEWWEEASNEHGAPADRNGNPMSVNHMCTSCYLQGRSTYMLPIKEFGVTTPQQFFSKYVSQGCWTRCLQCQKAQGVQVICTDLLDTLPRERHKTQQKREMCTICNEKGITWTTPLQYDSHGCSRCKKIIPSVDWEKQDLWNHSGGRVNHLVCKQCKALGYSIKNLTGYECKECRKQFGHLQFGKDVLGNANRRERAERAVTVCKDRLKSHITFDSNRSKKSNQKHQLIVLSCRQRHCHTKPSLSKTFRK